MSAVLRADWPAPPGVHAFTTLRHGAGSSLPPFDHFNLGNRHAADGDDTAAVERNRAELVAFSQLPSTPHWLKQVHGTEVLRVDALGASRATAPQADFLRGAGERWGGAHAVEPVADAAVTSQSGVVLAILTADCLPVVLASREGDEIGAAHAGWRGLAAGMLEKTVAAMHSPASRMVAWLGPAAGPAAYEVGEEVRDAFMSRDLRAATAFVSTREGHWHMNLYALACQRLTDVGVTQVYGGGLCTISDPQRFYSHRRDARTGRMATVVWMEGQECSMR